MTEKLKKKLKSRGGESISETLVALLISALALTMLAGAITSSLNVILQSREKIEEYYEDNELAAGVVKMEGGTKVTNGINIKDSTGAINQSFTVNYFKNVKIARYPVVSYKKPEVASP